MELKRKLLPAAVTVGLMMAGSAAWAGGTINGQNCEDQPNNGIGLPECMPAPILPQEGAMLVAAEQVISIASSISDDTLGCQAGATPVTMLTGIDPAKNNAVAVQTSMGGYQFITHEQVNNPATNAFGVIIGGSRKYVSADLKVGSALGNTIQNLDGTHLTDGAFSILWGQSFFDHGASDLDEHVIKDFFKGVAVPPTFTGTTVDNRTAAPVDIACADLAKVAYDPTQTAADRAAAQAELEEGLGLGPDLTQAGQCQVADVGEYSAGNLFETPFIVRDQGLEVTTKDYPVDDLFTAAVDPAEMILGEPKGKWLQVSYYKRPNGTGVGQLTYKKGRIAPFGALNCYMQLDGTVSGLGGAFMFNGTLVRFPNQPLP